MDRLCLAWVLVGAMAAGCANTSAQHGHGGDGSASHDLGLDGRHDLAGPVVLPDLAAGAVDAADGGDDLTQPPSPDLLPTGNNPGEFCNQASDCASRMCQPVLVGGQNVCVAPCASQADCAGFMNLFCEPTAPGAPNGWCVPRSPVHCSTCAADGDCGILSERCLKAPGDIAAACHIDCALAGAAACPSDYSCASVVDGNQTRKLCVPKTGVCLDAIGGFCDRVALPQPCSRQNAAGVCNGQRACLLAARRYDACAAMAPMYKMSCLQLDPAGCVLAFAPGATMTPDNCGACGRACPGYMKPNDNVTCDANQSCTFSCQGEFYDVNNDPSDGCEQNHGPTPGHTMQSAASLGTQVCNDGVTQTVSGHLYSDARVHENPMVNGFVTQVGSAPDVWAVVGSGRSNGFFPCVNDYGVNFSTSGGQNATPCYRLTMKTDVVTKSMTVTGSGSASMSDSSFTQYSNGATIFFTVEKVCNLPIQESVGYSFTFHL